MFHSRSVSLSAKSVTFALIALILAVIVAYYPSLLVPFYLDDRDSIMTNAHVHSETLSTLFNSYLRNRFIGYATLWGNYHYNGLEPFGYHVVNIAIHVINTVLVYFLASVFLNHFSRQDRQTNATPGHHNKLWALLIAAIWALHPLNSQAVIYIVQRLASIVSIFVLLTVIFYIKTRSANSIKSAAIYATLLVLSILGGLMSKQNYFTVFIFLYCWELYNSKPPIRKGLLWLTAVGLTALMIIAPFIPEFWQSLDKFTRDYNAGTRTEYFYTQMIVLWDYMLRFIYPFNLQLDIGVTLRNSLDGIVALAIVGHLALLMFAYRLRNTIPLFFVGIVFFYTSHTVESFIIPIKDLAFEHRAYIGNIGLVLALLALVKHYVERSPGAGRSKAVILASVLICLIGSFTIFQRATLWQDPVAFYANEVRLSPEHSRANASYGNELMKAQQFEEAEKYLKKSVDMDIAQGKITASGLTAFMTVLYEQRKYQEASHVVMMGLKYIKNPLERSMLLSNLAVGYIYMGYCDFAIGLLNTAIRLNPNNNDAKTNLAYCTKQVSGR